jgi:hypothetical protein
MEMDLGLESINSEKIDTNPIDINPIDINPIDIKEDTGGFYNNVDGELFYAPNRVLNRDFELDRKTYKDNKYPVGGWYWFDSEEEAKMTLMVPTVTEQDDHKALENIINMLEAIANG